MEVVLTEVQMEEDLEDPVYPMVLIISQTKYQTHKVHRWLTRRSTQYHNRKQSTSPSKRFERDSSIR